MHRGILSLQAELLVNDLGGLRHAVQSSPLICHFRVWLWYSFVICQHLLFEVRELDGCANPALVPLEDSTMQAVDRVDVVDVKLTPTLMLSSCVMAASDSFLINLFSRRVTAD